MRGCRHGGGAVVPGRYGAGRAAFGYGALALYHFLRRSRIWSSPAERAATLGLAAWPLAVLGWLELLLGLRSSTAALAMVYAPAVATLVASAVFLVAWAVGSAGPRRPGPP